MTFTALILPIFDYLSFKSASSIAPITANINTSSQTIICLFLIQADPRKRSESVFGASWTSESLNRDVNLK